MSSALQTIKPVVLHLLSTGGFGGAESVACNIISETGEKFDAYYCSPSGRINKVLLDRNIQHVHIDKIGYFNLKKVVQQIQPDIIHAHDFKASIAASLFAHKTTVISHIHQRPSWLNSSGLKPFLYQSREKKFKKIIVVSASIKNTKIFSRIPTNKLLVVENFVDRYRILKDVKCDSKLKYDVGFCGRLEPVKNPLEFIDIVGDIHRINNEIRAVIIGDGSLERACVERIKELNLQGVIKLVGFQDNPYGYIKNCKFLIQTSASEGFGLVAVEATLLETLVLAYDIKGYQELFSGSNDILCSNKDEVVEKYLSYDQSKKRYEAQLNKNLKSIESFTQSPDAWADKFNKLYLAISGVAR